MAFSLDKAELVSLFVEGILYGLYVALFVCTIYVLIYQRSTPQIHYGMFTVTVFMFVLATIHIVINLLHLIDAFNLSQIQPGAALVVFEDMSSFKNLFRSSVLLAEIILGDLVLIYRCYIAWGNSLRAIVLPLIVLLGTAGTCGGVVYSFSKVAPGSSMFASEKLQAFIITTQVLVFLNNVLCTGLVAWRLWHMSRAIVSREQRHSIRSVARIITESGLIIMVAWIIWIILNATRQTAEIIVLNSLAPLTGSAFCLIVSRVALNVSHDAHNLPRTNTNHRRGVGPGPGDSDRPDERLAMGSILPVLDGTGRPHRPMEINVSSRESVRVETEMGILYKDKMALKGLAHL